MDYIKQIFEVYHEILMILLITTASMVTGGRPHVTGLSEFGAAFFSNLSWVALVVVLSSYFGLPSGVSTVLGFSVGRWSYLLDEKVLMLIKGINWDLLKSWRGR